MGPQESPSARTYAYSLAIEARRLQHEARHALDQGNYTRATALIGDAELLAEDIHSLVGDIERHEFGWLMALDDCDVRDMELSVPPPSRMRLTLPSRSLRVAIGTSIVMSLALTEW